MSTAEAMREFTMPSLALGATVKWFPSGMRNSRPETAVAFRIGHRNVHLITATHGVREAVRHVDDPKLQLNRDQREMGAWDYTDDHVQREAALAELRDDVKRLQTQVTQLIAGTAREEQKETRQGEALKKYHALRQEAIDLGAEITGNPSTKELRAEIRKRRLSTDEEMEDGQESVGS